MNEDIKITRLPDILDPNKIADEKIQEKYGTCPFCGEKRKYNWRNGWVSPGVEAITDDWYGKHDEMDKGLLVWLRFWEKNIYWKRMRFRCYTCGAKWESPPYPKNIGEYE